MLSMAGAVAAVAAYLSARLDGALAAEGSRPVRVTGYEVDDRGRLPVVEVLASSVSYSYADERAPLPPPRRRLSVRIAVTDAGRRREVESSLLAYLDAIERLLIVDPACNGAVEAAVLSAVELSDAWTPAGTTSEQQELIVEVQVTDPPAIELTVGR